MSLLLDALRRAEEDSRRRNRHASATSVDSASPENTPMYPAQASSAELTLQAPTLSSSITSESTDAEVVASAWGAPKADFSDLTLIFDEPAAEELSARPTNAEVGQPVSPAMGSLPADQLARDAANPSLVLSAEPASVSQPRAATPESSGLLHHAPPVSGATQRQAILAAIALSGAGVQKVANNSQRRQWVFASFVLLAILSLATLLLSGKALFGSAGTLVVGKTVLPSVAPPVPTHEGLPAPPAEAEASGNLPAAVGDITGAPVADKNTPMIAPPVATGASSPSFERAREAHRFPDPGPVVSRPPAVTQHVTPTIAVRQGGATIGDERRGTDSLHNKPASLINSAYAAYQGGQTLEATRIYREVLKADPSQRDAWLGLAVIAHAGSENEAAMDAYKRVLRLEPQNATALAGLTSLIANAGEPHQESRLRELLARSPQEAELNHALALVLSAEQRWSEAQPLFFKAHALAPKEPQFAYNLAVSLDQMRKYSLAAQYYEAALGLAQGKAAGFDESNARTRLAALRAIR